MNSHLLSCGKFEIPDALTLDHEELRTELIKAAIQPGRVGIAAKKVAHLYLPHFAREEQMIFSAFGLLQDLAAERVLPDMAPVEPMIALLSGQHHALLKHHKSIDAAVEELLEEARNEKNAEIADLVCKLRKHEKTEDEVMFPTVLMIAKSIRDALATKQPGAKLDCWKPEMLPRQADWHPMPELRTQRVVCAEQFDQTARLE